MRKPVIAIENDSFSVDLQSCSIGSTSSEQITRTDRFRKLIPHLASLLDESEREAFSADPFEFTSSRWFFRGLCSSSFEDFQAKGKMEPLWGETSKAVFLTDSPWRAAQFITNDGAFVVVNPDKVIWKDPQKRLFDYQSPEVLAHLATLPPGDERNLYTCYDDFDMVSSLIPGKACRLIELKNPQPASAVEMLCVFDDGGTGLPVRLS